MNICIHTYRRLLAPGLLAGICLGTLLSACGSDTAIQPCEADLAAGELVITEIMAAPSGSDEGQEWIELYNASDRPVSLRGLALAYADDRDDGGNLYTFESDDEIAPGAYYVAGSVDPEFQPEYIQHSYGKALGRLGDSDGIIQVQCGTTIVDEVDYDHTGEGRSRMFDGTLEPDAIENDNKELWCAATESYDGENNGSPGMRNQPCMPGPENVGRCRDGDTWREPVKPTVGDLILTEVMTDPTGNAKPEDAEWFEVYVANDVDLAGLQLGTSQADDTILTGANVQMTLDAEDCQRVTAGTYLVFAGEVDPNLNGGLPNVDYPINFSLYNSDGAGVFVSTLAPTGGPDVIDAMTYPEVVDGAARSLSPDALDPQLNDDVTNWCFASETYGDGGKGSPGAPNPMCVDTTGLCLDGETTIALNPPGPGDLFITELMPDPSAVGDTDGEWLEIYVATDIHLGGLDVGKNGSPEQTLGDNGGQLLDCLPVAAGTHVLLASNVNPSENGGLPENVLQLDFSLSNSGGEVFVGTPDGALDSIAYPGSTAGAAIKLNPDAYDLGPAGNDAPENLCIATELETYGDGDFGTPGEMNAACTDDPDPPMGECDDNGMMRLPVPPQPGDLRITEFMPDPSAVTDSAGEWFEVQVLGDFDLNNLELGKEADVKFTYENPSCHPVTAGTTLVLALNGSAMENGGLPTPDIIYSGLSLTNSGGDLFVGHGGEAIDTVMYNGSTAGVARSLDPGDTTTFCDAIDPYGDGDLGTPGTANPECPVQVGPGECLDGNMARTIVAPTLGDLVITEYMPDPDAVGDTAGEWIEFSALTDFDLNHLELGEQGGVDFTYDVTECVPVSAGDHIVLARNGDMNINGGLPAVDIVYGTALSLSNGSDDFFLGHGGEVLDAVAYTGSTTGKAKSLDFNSYDPLENDNEMLFCDPMVTYGDGDEGTPGQANPVCN